jgi:hypothetical protein
MKLPTPDLGLVIPYAYLWHHEHRAGRDKATQNRPCVIVLSIKPAAGGASLVRVATVTHSPPDDLATSFEPPPAVKKHLGLHCERSWVVLDEVNEFTWPGPDLRPVSWSKDSVAYGLLPPRLFDALVAKLARVWAVVQGKTAPRD